MSAIQDLKTPGLILVTGANGFIGSSIVHYALQRGHRVRAAVRRQDAMTDLETSKELQPFVSSKALEVRLLEDMTSVSAFTDAMQGCTAVIHVASPFKILTHDLGDLSIFSRAATRAVLDAAAATPTMRNVVFTSSGYALGTYDEILDSHPVNKARLGGDLKAGEKLTAGRAAPPFTPAGEGKAPVERYVASKVASYHETLDYVKSHPQSHFGVVNIMPGYILGPVLLAKTKNDVFGTTNGYLAFCLMPVKLGAQYGMAEDADHPLSGYTCHVHDAAEIHVKATELQLGQGQTKSYIAFSDGPHGPKWADAEPILKRELPQLAQALPFPGGFDTVPGYFDSSEVEKDLLGRPLRGFDSAVKEVFAQWAALPDTPQ